MNNDHTIMKLNPKQSLSKKNQAATKIQANFKGHLQRKSKFPKHKLNDFAIRKYCNNLFTRILEEEMILDIVKRELVKDMDSKYKINRFYYEDVFDKIIYKVIRQECEQIVKQQTNHFVDNILQEKYPKQPLPGVSKQQYVYGLLSEQMLNRLVKSESESIVKGLVGQLSQEYVLEYFIENSIIDNRMVVNQVVQVVQDSLDEVIIQQYIEQVLIENLVQELALPMTVYINNQVQLENEQYFLDWGYQQFNQRMIMQVLLENVAEINRQENLQHNQDLQHMNRQSSQINRQYTQQNKQDDQLNRQESQLNSQRIQQNQQETQLNRQASQQNR